MLRGEHSKVCLAGLAAGNASGERLHISVIGKAKKPRYFKGVEHLPCRHCAQCKRWMSAERFEDGVT